MKADKRCEKPKPPGKEIVLYNPLAYVFFL